MFKRVVVAVVVAGLGWMSGLAGPAPAQADVVWLCKPGEQPDPCRESQRTTTYAADGTSRVADDPLPAAPPIDCFYVYPTVSQQPGVNADKAKDEELTAIARYQAARYSQECRVFAPVYRQLTLASIYTGSAKARAAGRKIAFADVREAFRAYLAQADGARGFVLIGHSQGTGMLRQLIREEIDAVPEVRHRLVSAVLLGGNVLVRKGQGTGGDFQQVPACTVPAQLQCVIAFSTFNAPPPDNTRFGRAPATDITGAGLPAGPDLEVLCTNPASLAANERRPLTSLIRSEPYPGVIGAGLTVTYGGPPPSAPTPWLQPAERYTGRCEASNGANVLMLEPVGGARRLGFFPTPDWGLHLTDANIALGELVDTVHAQAVAYLEATARAPRLGVALAFARGRDGARTCARGAVTVTVVGAGRGRVRRADIRLGGRRIARDTRAPLRATIPRWRLRRGTVARVEVVGTLTDGRTVRLTRALRVCRR
ncbi:MAG: hypothetical protein JWN65_2086 [Solirubrobacterales bacterium]|nr:hypothetical protein [Solirubrobacterales bacterium]